MLSYDLFKILVITVAIIFFWTLVFGITSTKIQPPQKFVVTNYFGNLTMQNTLVDDLSNQLIEDKLTHEVIEVDTIDLAASEDAGASILEAYSAVNDLDIMFVSMQGDESSKYEVEKGEDEYEILYERTYLETFTRGYGRMLHNLSLTDEDGYFKRLESYLNGYYTNGYADDSVLDTAKIEQDFRARAKGDKRYKKEAQIQKGVQGEIERVQKYRAALLSFYDLLERGKVEIVNTPCMESENENEPKTDRWNGKGNFSINICKTEEDSALLSKYVSCSASYVDEGGKEQYKFSALNMNVCFFDSNGDEDSYRYEGLVYITNLLSVVYA